MQPDSALVEATVAGQAAAFDTLVRRYERSVRATAMNVVKDRHLARDVAQEAFLKAYQGLAVLRRPEAFGGWLMQITHRCALDAVRKRASQAALGQYATASGSNNGRLAADKQELLAAVMQLPMGERQAVMLRYFGCHTVKEVADISGRSIGTITKQLSRAHRRLRNILKEF